MSQLKFSFECGYKESQVLRAQSCTLGAQTELRGHIMKPAEMRHICHLAAWWLKHKRFDLFKPWHLRRAGSREASPQRSSLPRIPEEDTQGGSWELSTALLHNHLHSGLTHKNRKESEAKLGKMAQVRKPTVLALRELWQFPSLVRTL